MILIKHTGREISKHTAGRSLLCLSAAKQSADQPAKSIGTYSLLLFLAAKISHYDRCQKHKDLCDLPHSKSCLIAYLLCYLALIIAQDMPKDTACIGLSRRSGLLSSTKDHAAKSAQIVENASVVILFKRIIQILGTIGRCRVVRKSIKERR